MILLRGFKGHENIISIKNIILNPPTTNFKDVYIVTDLMVRNCQASQILKFYTLSSLRPENIDLAYSKCILTMHR